MRTDIEEEEEILEVKATKYKWFVLFFATLGTLMATINSGIILIALPNIFKGISLNPLTPGNSSYLLWMLMGFLMATAVLLVSLGRLGDLYGRAKMFSSGFAIFTFFSILLSVTWLNGSDGALYLIAMRIGQGIGGAFLFANSGAIITDAFSSSQRGLALGINSVAGVGGAFIGLVLGGLLAPIDWRLVFLVSVPFGLLGTIGGFLVLKDMREKIKVKIDWLGNITFALGLILVLISITYGIEPYGGHTMGWTSPVVLSEMASGIVLLIIFAIIELKSDHPMLQLSLFRIRSFAAGNFATLLAALARGGLMFILIIWLQGIWLPLHGYSFARTPLMAGIYMLPLTLGFLISGPISGIMSDKHGARPFAVGGMLITALSFGFLDILPVNFSYIFFALTLLLMGIGFGMFASPNQAGIMNSLPADQRGAGAGTINTFQNSAMVLSIGIFFTLIILGLASSLPHSLTSGLIAQGINKNLAIKAGSLPPVGSLFASFLGINPVHALLGSAVTTAHHPSYLLGRSFFPSLLEGPFSTGLHEAFGFAIVAALISAFASTLRGGRYVHGETHGHLHIPHIEKTGAVAQVGTSDFDLLELESGLSLEEEMGH